MRTKNLHTLTMTSKQPHHLSGELRKSKEWIVADVQPRPLLTISVAVTEYCTKSFWERKEKQTHWGIRGNRCSWYSTSDVKVLKLDHGEWTQVIMPFLLQPLKFIQVADIECMDGR